MPEFTCPVCDTDNEVDTEYMPNNAVDEIEHECHYCLTRMKIGWISEIEVRSFIDPIKVNK